MPYGLCVSSAIDVGDLLYLELTTLEGQDCFITATPSGFFLNKSTSRENFDPAPRKTSHLHKHLVGLLSQVGLWVWCVEDDKTWSDFIHVLSD